MVSELCRKAMELLPTIGYNLIKHKCFVEDLDDLNDAEPRFFETPQPPNSTSKPTNTTPNNSKNSILKTKAPQSPRRLCPAFPKNHPSLLPLLHTPHLVQWAAPDRGSTEPGEVRQFARIACEGGWEGDNSVGPSKGGPTEQPRWVGKRSKGAGHGGSAGSPNPVGGHAFQGLGGSAGGEEGGVALGRAGQHPSIKSRQ